MLEKEMIMYEVLDKLLSTLKHVRRGHSGDSDCSSGRGEEIPGLCL
jgi:hypothetical protein